jgi:ubiquinone/menaquinone biosynthesis C-methylase UbiE
MSDYDKFAKDFSSTRNYAWNEFDIVKPKIWKGDRVLDLGCGNGRFRQFLGTDLVAKGAYFGLDISEKLLSIARKTYPDDHFFIGDFGQNLPFGAENFEVIVAIASFHHLTNKKAQNKFLSECRRVLKPNGKIFITTWVLPKKYFWRNFWTGRVFSKNWIIPFGKEKYPRIYRNVTDKDLSKLLKKHGFLVERAENFKNRNYVILAQKNR